jgi:hypothetical protein
MFPAIKNGKGYFIDNTGKILLETEYLVCSTFHDGKALISINNKFGFIDITGSLVIDPIFEMVCEFSEGFWKVKSDGKWGFIDSDGNFVIQPQYHDVGIFSNGIVGVQSERLGNIMYIDKNCNTVIEDSGLMTIHDFSEGLLCCADVKTKLYGYKNTSGDWHIKPQFSSAQNFFEGLAGVHKQETKNVNTAFIDKNNNEILPPKYETVLARFSEGLAVVTKKIKNNYKSGCINKEGDLVITFQFDIIDEFHDGMARIKTRLVDKKSGFINNSGEIQIKPQYSMVLSPFRDGLALVFKNKKKYYVNKNGEIIWEFS